MLGKILVLSAFILVCSGCSTLSKTQEDKPVTAPPVSAFAANKPVFAPTYKSEEPDKYYDAIEIYDSSPKAPQGVYQHDGLVFVVVVIDPRKEDIEYLEGTAMLRTVALLRKSYPGLPPKFYIRNKVVEKEEDYNTGIYRYATVYREKDIIQKLRK